MKIDQIDRFAANPGEQQITDEERELVDEIYNRLDIWEEQCRPYHDTAREMREVLHMRDPRQDSNITGEPGKQRNSEKTLQLHTLMNTVMNSIADQMERIPEVKLLPETDQYQETADQLQDMLRYVIYTVNNFELIHRRRMEDFFTVGTSILQIAWDSGMNHGTGDIAMIRWPVEAFIWDPIAEDINDARALMKVSWHPLSWYKDHYPDKYMYIASDMYERNDVGLPQSQKDRDSRDEERALMIEYWYRTWDATRKCFKINVAYVAGGALLDSETDVYDHGEYPFVIDVHSYIEGQPVGEGMVTEFRTMQQYINKYQRYIDTNLRMSSKARMFTRQGNGINPKKLADWEQDVITGTAIRNGEDWAWLQHAPFNQAIFQAVSTMKNELAADAGVSSVMRGQLPSDYASGKAVTALQETGSKISTMRTAGLRAGFKRVAEQILWLMAQYYDNDRVALITGSDGSVRRSQMNMNAMFRKKSRGAVPPPPYIVQIEINNRNPMRVEARNESLMNAYTMAAQHQQIFPLSSLFSMMDLEGKDQLVPILRENETIQAQMEQMAQQLEEAQAQMNQLAQENQNLRRVSTQMTDALSNVSASRNPMARQSQTPAAYGGSDQMNPDRGLGVAEEARQTMAVPPQGVMQ